MNSFITHRPRGDWAARSLDLGQSAHTHSIQQAGATGRRLSSEREKRRHSFREIAAAIVTFSSTSSFVQRGSMAASHKAGTRVGGRRIRAAHRSCHSEERGWPRAVASTGVPTDAGAAGGVERAEAPRVELQRACTAGGRATVRGGDAPAWREVSVRPRREACRGDRGRAVRRRGWREGESAAGRDLLRLLRSTITR